MQEPRDEARDSNVEVTQKPPKSPKFEAPPALEPPRLGLRALPEGVSCSLAAKEGLVEW